MDIDLEEIEDKKQSVILQELLDHLEAEGYDDEYIDAVQKVVSTKECYKLLQKIAKLFEEVDDLPSSKWDEDSVLFGVVTTEEGMRCMARGSLYSRVTMWAQFFAQHPQEYIIIQEAIQVLKARNEIMEVIRKGEEDDEREEESNVKGYR